MKLKYILPVATIASAATIVTPLFGCSTNKNWDYSWNFLTQGTYTPIIPQAESSPLSDANATQKYIDDFAANHLILADDFFYNANEDYESLIAPGMKEITTINAFNAKLNVKKVDTQSHLVSMDIYSEIDAKINLPDEPITIHNFVEISLVDIQYEVKWVQRSGKEFWLFQSILSDKTKEEIEEILEILNENDGWSMSGKIGDEGGSAGGGWHIDSFNFNKSKIPQTEDEITNMLVCLGVSTKSHYLEKIEHK